MGARRRQFARGARRLITVSLAAVLTALIAQRINPPLDGPTTATPIEPVLARRLPALDLDVASLTAAARSLADAAAIKVVVDGPYRTVRRMSGPAKGPPVLGLRNVTVGRAVVQIIEHFGDSVDPLTYLVDADTIHIGREADLDAREPLLVRAYDVRDFENEDRPSHGSGLFDGVAGNAPADTIRVELGTGLAVQLIQSEIFPTKWDASGGPRGGIQVWAGHLIVTAPARGHRAIERLLFLVRHPVPPAGTIAKGPP